MVVLERRTGAKLAKGLLNGPEVAVPEAGFPDPNGRRFRRVRKEGKEEPPDACVGSTGGVCEGMAAWDGGPLPEGVLFGGTRPSWGADKELGRELLGAWFRADFGESNGIKEGGWGILVCPRKSAVFAPPGDVRRLSVVTSMALRCNWTLRETSQDVVGERPHCMLREQQGRKTAYVGRDDGSGGRGDGGDDGGRVGNVGHQTECAENVASNHG